MAIHVDNSKNVNADDIKKMLINTFNRSAEKSVHEAKYDRTILATVQYCTDATLGQYKIKYQDSYFTAYSRDVDKIYPVAVTDHGVFLKNPTIEGIEELIRLIQET